MSSQSPKTETVHNVNTMAVCCSQFNLSMSSKFKLSREVVLIIMKYLLVGVGMMGRLRSYEVYMIKIINIISIYILYTKPVIHML